MALYYIIRQVLQDATAILLLQNAKVFQQNATIITKCERYYEMRRLFKNASLQCDCTLRCTLRLLKCTEVVLFYI